MSDCSFVKQSALRNESHECTSEMTLKTDVLCNGRHGVMARKTTLPAQSPGCTAKVKICDTSPIAGNVII